VDGPTGPDDTPPGGEPPGQVPADPGPADPGPPVLASLGLAAGDRVRWRDRSSARWREGRVVGRERDGSVGVRDARGASRALMADRLAVRARGPRGGIVWEPVADRAARTEQLGLWGRETPSDEVRAP
jgi:hypothetical protein